MTTTRTHFTGRIRRTPTWTPDGETIVEHVAGVEDYAGLALALVRPFGVFASHARDLH